MLSVISGEYKIVLVGDSAVGLTLSLSQASLPY